MKISQQFKIFTFVMYLINKINELTKGINLLADLLNELNKFMNYKNKKR